MRRLTVPSLPLQVVFPGVVLFIVYEKDRVSTRNTFVENY